MKKSRIQYFERSELRLHFEFIKNAKNSQFGEFLKTWSCGQTLLPDKPILKWQKLAENAQIEKFIWDIFRQFSTSAYELFYIFELVANAFNALFLCELLFFKEVCFGVCIIILKVWRLGWWMFWLQLELTVLILLQLLNDRRSSKQNFSFVFLFVYEDDHQQSLGFMPQVQKNRR